MPKWGPVKLRKVLTHFGSFELAFKAKPFDLMQVDGVGKELANTFKITDGIQKRVAQELSFCEQHAIKIISINSADYPFTLKQNPDAPMVLFALGTPALNSYCNLSVVGTRKLSKQSLRWMEENFPRFENIPLNIISGLAHGTDAFAHKLALKYNLPTTAVLAHGLDMLYPAANKNLAQQITKSENSCLLTEFPSGTIANKEHFPRRNRIVAGLCKGTLVVESAVTGGSMITAKYAFDYSREVMALPKSPSTTIEDGCNALIKRNVAALVENAQDVLKILDLNEEISSQTQLPLVVLNAEEEAIYTCIHQNKILEIDTLSELLNIPVGSLAFTLLQLELKGLISKQVGGAYKAL